MRYMKTPFEVFAQGRATLGSEVALPSFLRHQLLHQALSFILSAEAVNELAGDGFQDYFVSVFVDLDLDARAFFDFEFPTYRRRNHYLTF